MRCASPLRDQFVVVLCAWCFPFIPGSESVKERSVMFWQTESSDEIVSNLRTHKENVTAVSPCLYAFDGHGKFVRQGSVWKSISPYLKDYVEMGLEVIPLIGNLGGIGGARKLGNQFVENAINEALKMGYAGYNFDNELRGAYTEASWAPFLPLAAPWMSFLNTFADALHRHNLTLSTDINGCCGWVDTAHPATIATGHCFGAFAKYEFQGTSCAMYKDSHVDRIWAMGTYSGRGNGHANTGYGPGFLAELASVAKQEIGDAKYGFGFAGGWPFCGNGTDPDACQFNDAAKDDIRHVRDVLGVQHISHWAGIPRSQAEWDLWGYFLHGVGGPARMVV